MAAIPDQNIANYWKAWTTNGNGNQGKLLSDMQQYGVNPFDIARSTGSNVSDIMSNILGPATTQQGQGTTTRNLGDGFTLGDKVYLPQVSGGWQDQGDGSVWSGDPTVNGYRTYDYHPEWGNDVTKYNGQNYFDYDNTGKQTGTGVLSGFENNTWLDNAIPFITAAIATYGASAVAGAAGAGAEASGGGLSAGGSGTGLTTGGGLTGTGLNVAPGAGLNLAQTTSSLSGLSPTIGGDALLNGAGLTTGLTGAGTGLGLDAATAGNAILDEAGLTGGLANASGSLLPPSITDGSYQMADGTIIPNTTSTGVPAVPPVTTTPSPTSIPKVPIPTGSGGSNGLGLNDWAKLLAGGVDWYKQQQAGNGLLDYLKAQQAKIDNLYSQGSPELQLMQQTLDRKDAAAGRMSQYGTRATDLAGRIAQIKADATTRMTTGIGALYKAGLDQKASAPAGLMSALSSSGGLENVLKSLGVPLNNVLDILKNKYGMSDDMATEYLSGLSDPSVYNAAQDAAFNDSNPDLNGSIYDYPGDN